MGSSMPTGEQGSSTGCVLDLREKGERGRGGNDQTAGSYSPISVGLEEEFAVEPECLVSPKPKVCVNVNSVFVFEVLNTTAKIDIHRLRGRAVNLHMGGEY